MAVLNRPREIWSGGQTGVDRGALDAAIELAIPIGGWIPRGRLAEDGAIPVRYAGLRETTSVKLDVRTRRNVRDTDATLVLFFDTLSGGTAYTVKVAESLGKPLLVVDMGKSVNEAAHVIREWLSTLSPAPTLNVAGPRASSQPMAETQAKGVLIQALSPG